MIETARIGRNLGAVASAHVVAQGLAFVVSIAVTRALGVEPYGVFAFGFAFPSWFVLLASLGLDSVVTIDVAANRSKASTYLTAVSVVRIPLVLIAVLLLWVSLSFAVSDPHARSVVLILGIANLVGSYNATFDSIFRAHERFEVVAYLMVGQRVITTGAVLLLIALRYDLLAVSLAHVLAAVATTVLSIAFLRRRFTWFARPFDYAIMRRVVRRARPFALTALVVALMISTAPVLLTFLRGPTATGYFNAAFVLLFALLSPLQIYNMVFLPHMSRLHHDSPASLPLVLRRTQRLSFAFGLPIALGASLYAEPLLVGLFGNAFLASAPTFTVLALALAVMSASLGAGTALNATDRAALELRFGAWGAALNVVLCLLLIPLAGPVGAAWAFLSATTLIAVLRLDATSRLFAPYGIIETTAPAASAGALMLLAVFTMSLLPPLAGMAVGATIYAATLAVARGVTRDDIVILREITRGAFGSPERLRP